MKKNKKLIFIVGIFPVISESWLVEQIVSLVDMGMDVRIFSFRRGKESHISEKIKKYNLMNRVIYLDFPENYFIRAIRGGMLFIRVLFLQPRALFNIFNIKKYGADAYSLKYLFWSAPMLNRIKNEELVHCHFGTVGNKFLILRKILNLKNKFVVSFYGYDISKIIKSHGGKVYQKLINQASYFLPNSELMREEMIKIGFDRGKTIVINNGLNLNDYKYYARKITDNEKLKIIFVGRFVEKKGIEDMLKAVAVVYRKYKNIELNIVGGGEKEYEKEIKHSVDKLGIKGIVNFFGMQQHEKVLDLYGNMHVSILLSKTAKDGDKEGLPYVLVEAQATGLPTISTVHAGIPEVVIDKQTGMTVKEGDYQSAAKCIELLIDNPDILSRYSRGARQLTIEKFGFKNINKKLLSIYDNVKHG